MSLTDNPNDPKLKEGQQNTTGQHSIYLILSEEERAKGYVRPLRYTYTHRGRKIESEGTIETLEEALVEMSDFAKQEYTIANGWVAFIRYPESKSPLTGRFIKQIDLDAFNNKKEYAGGCGGATTMGHALSETYARDPKFYGATFCVGCNKHLPLDEFIWDDGEMVGS